jgi:hypothetical protein
MSARESHLYQLDRLQLASYTVRDNVAIAPTLLGIEVLRDNFIET